MYYSLLQAVRRLSRVFLVKSLIAMFAFNGVVCKRQRPVWMSAETLAKVLSEQSEKR
jgi:hypothetical protein